MKFHVAATGLVLLAGVTATLAQDVIVIEPQQEVVIREYIRESRSPRSICRAWS